MNAANTNDILNRLLIVHFRSLPHYLHYATPSWHQGDETARDTLQVITDDQLRTVDRLGEMILENDGTVEYGVFPMLFTSYHDLDFSYLLNKLVDRQKKDIRAIEACVEMLTFAPMAKAVAEECLGAAKGHLDSLEDLRTIAPLLAN